MEPLEKWHVGKDHHTHHNAWKYSYNSSWKENGYNIWTAVRNFNCFETHSTTHTPTHTHYPSKTAIKTFTPNVSLRIFATSLRSEVSSSCMAAINGVLDHHRKETSLEGTFSRTFSLLLVQSSKPFRSNTMTLWCRSFKQIERKIKNNMMIEIYPHSSSPILQPKALYDAWNLWLLFRYWKQMVVASFRTPD